MLARGAMDAAASGGFPPDENAAADGEVVLTLVMRLDPISAVTPIARICTPKAAKPGRRPMPGSQPRGTTQNLSVQPSPGASRSKEGHKIVQFLSSTPPHSSQPHRRTASGEVQFPAIAG
jgi:hypothetical protein